MGFKVRDGGGRLGSSSDVEAGYTFSGLAVGDAAVQVGAVDEDLGDADMKATLNEGVKSVESGTTTGFCGEEKTGPFCPMTVSTTFCGWLRDCAIPCHLLDKIKLISPAYTFSRDNLFGGLLEI
jgi:hypothetical protein